MERDGSLARVEISAFAFEILNPNYARESDRHPPSFAKEEGEDAATVAVRLY